MHAAPAASKVKCTRARGVKGHAYGVRHSPLGNRRGNAFPLALPSVSPVSTVSGLPEEGHLGVCPLSTALRAKGQSQGQRPRRRAKVKCTPRLRSQKTERSR